MSTSDPFLNSVLTARAPHWVLDHVRQNSCYRILRWVIDLWALCWIVFWAAVGAFGLAMATQLPRATAVMQRIAEQQGRAGALPLGIWITHAFIIGVGVLGIVFGVAARQFALLLVDIADILLDARRGS